MCTVTLLPTAAGYLLATNRDESPRRGPADPPEEQRVGGRRALFPRDSDAGGTWIAVDEAGRTLCLLNGDRPPAAPPPATPLSRGRLLLELLAVDDTVDVALDRRLDAGDLPVRPFQLLEVRPGVEPLCVHWDGRGLRRESLGSAAVLISSTHRTDEVHDRREQAFAALADSWSPGVTGAAGAGADPVDQQRDWHAGHAPGAPGGDAFSVCMHREDARSVSFTQVRVEPETVWMAYRAGQPCRPGPVVERSLPRR